MCSYAVKTYQDRLNIIEMTVQIPFYYLATTVYYFTMGVGWGRENSLVSHVRALSVYAPWITFKFILVLCFLISDHIYVFYNQREIKMMTR